MSMELMGNSGATVAVPERLEQELNSGVDLVLLVPLTHCVQCQATQRKADKIDLTISKVAVGPDDVDLFDFAIGLTGERQLPLVLNTHDLQDRWNGFIPDRLDRLKETLATAA